MADRSIKTSSPRRLAAAAAFSCCLSNLCLMALAVQATMAIATRRRADDILLYAARYACAGRGRLHAVKFYLGIARWRASGVARVRRPRVTSSAALARASKSRVARLALRNQCGYVGLRRVFRFPRRKGTPFGALMTNPLDLTFRRQFARWIPDARLTKYAVLPQSHQCRAKTGSSRDASDGKKTP